MLRNTPNLCMAQEPQLARTQTLSTTGVRKHRPKERLKTPGRSLAEWARLSAGEQWLKVSREPVPAQCSGSFTDLLDCASWGDKEAFLLSSPQCSQKESPLAVNFAHQILGESFSSISTKEYSLLRLNKCMRLHHFSQFVRRNVELNGLIHFSSIVKIICWLLLISFLDP